jgi:CBS domain-containing protein
VRVGQALSRGTVSMSPSATVGQASSMVMRGDRPDFAIVDPHSRQLLGIVSSSDVAQAVERDQWYSSMAEIMRPAAHVPRVTLNTTLSDVQEELAEASSRVAAVYDGPSFQGLISLDDVRRAFLFLSRGGTVPRRPAWETTG